MLSFSIVAEKKDLKTASSFLPLPHIRIPSALQIQLMLIKKKPPVLFPASIICLPLPIHRIISRLTLLSTRKNEREGIPRLGIRLEIVSFSLFDLKFPLLAVPENYLFCFMVCVAQWLNTCKDSTSAFAIEILINFVRISDFMFHF